jgi:hypothetical protein
MPRAFALDKLSASAPASKIRGRVMPHWILTAVDHRSEIWKVYPIQRIVVEAPDEREARQKVAAAAPRFPESNPWLDPALTSCEKAKERPRP